MRNGQRPGELRGLAAHTAPNDAYVEGEAHRDTAHGVRTLNVSLNTLGLYTVGEVRHGLVNLNVFEIHCRR